MKTLTDRKLLYHYTIKIFITPPWGERSIPLNSDEMGWKRGNTIFTLVSLGI